MGYYSTIEPLVKIKKDKIEEFKKEVKRLREQEDDKKEDFVYYFLDILDVDEEGYLEFEEYHSKFYDDYSFAKFLKPYVEEGNIYFTGEDFQKWGYYFDGKGKAFEIDFIEKIGKEV